VATWEDVRGTFADAGAWFVSLADAVGDRWEEPGLGEWDVRALVGHTGRAFLTVEAYLAQPAEEAEVATAAAYFQAVRVYAGQPGVAERGREAGAALGDDPAGAVRAIADRVTGLLESCDGGELVTCLAGGMRLIDYLPTRTFELCVHGADLARALGELTSPPEAAAQAALALVDEIALADGRAGELLLAVTGRTGPDFSVL
jgi:uncharacterized protein (TIGR03083 family)